MKTITIITPANIEVNYRLAGAGSRLAAFVVDLLLQLAACLVVIAILLFGIARLGAVSYSGGGYTMAITIIICAIILVVYPIVCETWQNGQTIGKRLFGLRVICENGQPVGFTQALVRGLFRIGLDILYVGIFSIMFSKRHKRFGDMAAGTVVVSEDYNKNDSGMPESYAIEPKEGIMLNLSHISLNPNEKYIISEYFLRKNSLPDGGLYIRKQIDAYIIDKWQLDPAILDDELLKML